MIFGDLMVVLNLAAVALCLIVATFANRHQAISASRPVVAPLVPRAGWSLTEALISGVPNPGFKFEILYVQNALVTFVQLIWVLVTQAVTGGVAMAHARWLILTCLAVVIALLCQTNHWRDLILSDIRLEMGKHYPTFECGALFIFFALYGYGVLLYGTAVLWRARQPLSGSRRVESNLWLLCMAAPTLVDLVSFTPLFNSIESKLTPVTLAISSALAGWA